MKKIELTKGKYATIDDDDYELVSKHSWRCVAGYAMTYETGKSHKERKIILMHRLINNTPEGFDTDHVNGDRLDNRKENLRTATRSQNCKNKGKSKVDSTSMFKGVMWDKKSKKWRAYIYDTGRNIYLGLFELEKDAANAYNEASKNLHGVFSIQNKV